MKTALLILALSGFHQIYAIISPGKLDEEDSRYNDYLGLFGQSYPYDIQHAIDIENFVSNIVPSDENEENIKMYLIKGTRNILEKYEEESDDDTEKRLLNEEFFAVPLNHKELEELGTKIAIKHYKAPQDLNGVIKLRSRFSKKYKEEIGEEKRNRLWFLCLVERLLHQLNLLNEGIIQGKEMEKQMNDILKKINSFSAQVSQQVATVRSISPTRLALETTPVARFTASSSFPESVHNPAQPLLIPQTTTGYGSPIYQNLPPKMTAQSEELLYSLPMEKLKLQSTDPQGARKGRRSPSP